MHSQPGPCMPACKRVQMVLVVIDPVDSRQKLVLEAPGICTRAQLSLHVLNPSASMLHTCLCRQSIALQLQALQPGALQICLWCIVHLWQLVLMHA